MFIHECHKRIRYADTDQMGYLYYGNYPVLYEIGRSEMMRSLGSNYREMESDLEIMMPVIAVESRYKKPLHYDENATIRTILKELPTKLITFHHEILNDDMEIVHTGLVKLFFIDMKTNKRVSSPPYLNDKLSPYFEKLDK